MRKISLTVTYLARFYINSTSSLISKNSLKSTQNLLTGNRENVASKLENFSKLEVTLRNLKIKFDSKMIDAIIKEKRGEALRLLYQLRMALEKVYPPTDISVIRKSNSINLLYSPSNSWKAWRLVACTKDCSFKRKIRLSQAYILSVEITGVK